MNLGIATAADANGSDEGSSLLVPNEQGIGFGYVVADLGRVFVLNDYHPRATAYPALCLFLNGASPSHPEGAQGIDSKGR